jgi:hypothetical protein
LEISRGKPLENLDSADLQMLDCQRSIQTCLLDSKKLLSKKN